MIEEKNSDAIQSLYAIAMVHPLSVTVCGVGEEYPEYPSFTPEKQIKLIKYLLEAPKYSKYFKITKTFGNNNEPLYYADALDIRVYRNSFEQALAALMVYVYQDIPSTSERKRITEILEL